MDPVAEIDQVRAELGGVAPVVRRHYTLMLEQGFTEVQAFQLTRDFHAAYWSTTNRVPADPPAYGADPESR